jgi:hypothetical protein
MTSTFCIVFRIKIVAFDSFFLGWNNTFYNYVPHQPYLVILSDCFYIKFYVKGLVYNFHHLISLKQLEDFKIMLLFNNLYLEVKLNNSEVSYLNLPSVSE